MSQTQEPIEKTEPSQAPPQDHRKPKSFKMIFGPIILLSVLSGLLGVGISQRVKRLQKIDKASNDVSNRLPVVQVVTAKQTDGSSGLVLPGDVQAIQVTNVSARTSG